MCDSRVRMSRVVITLDRPVHSDRDKVGPSRVRRLRERWSGGAAFVVVMEAAVVGYLNDGAAGWRSRSPRHGRILVHGQVRTPLVIMRQEESERVSKGPLIPHDDVIETECRAYCYAPNKRA